jgi:Arm DNA-binding domain
MATKLTKRICEAATSRGAGWSTVWDSTLSGFGMRVRGTGRKTLVVFYRTRAGEKRLITLGRFPELSMEDARKQARLVLGEASQGGDPLRSGGVCGDRRPWASSHRNTSTCTQSSTS